MKDEHLDSVHQETKPQVKLLPSNFDVDELQPLFFDLISLDKVEEVKSILHHFIKLGPYAQRELKKLVASSGSAAMAQVVYSIADQKDGAFLIESIKGMNFETFRWFLYQVKDETIKLERWEYVEVLEVLLKSGSLEMMQEYKSYHLDRMFTVMRREHHQRTGRFKSVIRLYISKDMMAATAGCPDRENLLLLIWAALRTEFSSFFDDRFYLGDAMINVAHTTCSLVLTKALLAYGAEIDFRRGDTYLTPLHQAARQSSPQAAELMKFLLYQGADPEIMPPRQKKKISEERGAKEIAKWLGMSWDELTQKIRLDRERGTCPPEYT
jgi:hypothetical protein